MPAEPLVRSLTPEATAYLQLPGGWFLNNAGRISGRERTLVVDTCATEARSRRLLDVVGDRTPLSAVITYAHGDHAEAHGYACDRMTLLETMLSCTGGPIELDLQLCARPARPLMPCQTGTNGHASTTSCDRRRGSPCFTQVP